MNPAEIGLPTYSVENFDGGFNSERLRESLELIDEKRDHALSRIIARNRVVASYYNSKVWEQKFEVGDLVLNKILITNGVFGLNWEGRYVVTGVVRPSTCRLNCEERKPLPHPWNVEHLKKYYQ